MTGRRNARNVTIAASPRSALSLRLPLRRLGLRHAVSDARLGEDVGGVVRVVGYVNFDRADHGLPPVVLGTNPAAQLHAEDMLEHQYVGHWWVDGRKPYMVYAQTGGTSYAFENAASMGWTDDEWNSAECDEVSVACKIVGPLDAILTLGYRMVYDDAHADWRHRDNILGESHRTVNIGVGWNGRRLTLVQHFEGGSVEADGPPVLDARGVLSLSLTKREPGDFISGSISIYYDPPPSAKTPAEIEALKNTEGFHSYCLGGGFTANCPDSALRVLKPPADGSPYPDLPPNVVVATSWTETATPTGGRFSFTAEVGPLMREPGVYTVVVRRDSSLEVLVALSLTVTDIVSRYDTDGTPGGSRSEAVAAVLDYLLRKTISRDEAVQVVTAYLLNR